jgi:hypothetical protein
MNMSTDPPPPSKITWAILCEVPRSDTPAPFPALSSIVIGVFAVMRLIVTLRPATSMIHDMPAETVKSTAMYGMTTNMLLVKHFCADLHSGVS